MKLSEMTKKLKTNFQPPFLVLSLLVLGACKQSDFYEKNGLSELDNGNKDSNNPQVIPTSTPTATPTPVVTSTPVPTATPTPVVTSTPVPTATPTPVVTSTPVPTATPTPAVTPTPVPTPTSTPTPVVKLEEKVENFTQNLAKNGDVDILWVIDNSGSMENNQQALAENFNSFINSFIKKDVDFKMAITTTDASLSYNGKMVCDSNKLNYASAINNRASFVNYYKSCVKVGVNGSGVEQGLKTAKGFFDRYASSFIRKDAYLAIVFISDEEDQSDKTKEEYLNYFKNLKASKGMVKAYSIVTQKILPYMNVETIGTRYNFVAEQTNGLRGDIDADFASTLSNIGETISNLADTFSINGKPYNNQVQVLVNGIEVKEGWSFDSISKSIKFDVNSLPINGASIVVKYKVQVN